MTPTDLIIQRDFDIHAYLWVILSPKHRLRKGGPLLVKDKLTVAVVLDIKRTHRHYDLCFWEPNLDWISAVRFDETRICACRRDKKMYRIPTFICRYAPGPLQSVQPIIVQERAWRTVEKAIPFGSWNLAKWTENANRERLGGQRRWWINWNCWISYVESGWGESGVCNMFAMCARS